MFSFGENISKRKGTIRQIVTVCSANLMTMAFGCLLGWSSPTLPKLELPDAVLHVTPEQASWIGSLVPLGASIGPPLGGYLADQIGRKRTMLSFTLPLLMSWIITAAQNVAMIYAGRFIAAISVSAAYAIAPMYSGEIAEKSIRGGLGSTGFLYTSFGLLYAYSIGPYVSYIWLGIISMIVPIVFAVTFFFAPESPYYLVSKGKQEEASKALQWLRGSTEEMVKTELYVIKEFVEDSYKNKRSFKDLLSVYGNIKAFFISCGLMVFQILCGFETYLIYCSTIFSLAGGSLSDDLSTIIIGVDMVVFAVVSPLFVDKIGRKPMLYMSASGMAAAELTLGMYFYYKDVEERDLSFFGWLPVLCLVIIFAFYSIGYGPLPMAISGEIFPANIKSVASSLTVALAWFLGFVVTKWFQTIVTNLGMHVAFWIFAGFCVFSNVFVFFFLPETKGKTFQEIQDILNQTK